MRAVIAELEKVLKLFTAQDIQDIVMIEFPEIRWKDLQNRVMENRRSLAKKYHIEVFLKICVEKRIPAEVLEHRLIILRLIAVGKTTTRVWTGFELRTKQIDTDIEERAFCERLERTFLHYEHRMKVYSVNWENRTIACIIKQNSRSKKGQVSPYLYFQYFPNTPYLFLPKSESKTNLLNIIANGLGYESVKQCKLTGRHVGDLFKMMRCRDGGAVNSNIQPAKFEPGCNKNDFCQYNARKKYGMNICGGESPPLIENLTVGLDHCEWDVLPDNFNSSPIKNIKLTISTPNVLEFLREMIAKDYLERPAPMYVQGILKRGENQFKIRAREA